MSQLSLTIGALATHTNTNVPTIRYYEEIGLLPQAQRAPNGRRYYRDAEHHSPLDGGAGTIASVRRLGRAGGSGTNSTAA